MTAAGAAAGVRLPHRRGGRRAGRGRRARDRTGRVQIRRITITAGHAAGLHIHNGPVFGSIESGAVTYQIDGQPAAVLRAGDVFHEPEATRIARFDPHDGPVTFLAHFLLEAGQSAEIDFPHT